MFLSIPGAHPLHASTIPFPKSVSRCCPMSPGKAESSLLRTTALDEYMVARNVGMGYFVSKQKHKWSTEKRESKVLSLRLLGRWGQVSGEPTCASQGPPFPAGPAALPQRGDHGVKLRGVGHRQHRCYHGWVRGTWYRPGMHRVRKPSAQ